ncbi:unnamed protein product [Lampetra planeri]
MPLTFCSTLMLLAQAEYLKMEQAGTVLPAGTIFHPAEFRSSGPKGSQHLTPVEPPVEPSKESEAAGTRFLFFCFFFPGGAAPIRPFSSRSQSPWGPSNEDPFQTVRFK